MLSASGAPVHPEVLSSRGRMDIVVETDDRIFIMELKCNQDSEKAIQQILEKKYYEKYQKGGRDIFLMGINLDSDKRSLDDWQCRELNSIPEA